jgi:5-formyltetrahydrofolate cyclo-ligase
MDSKFAIAAEKARLRLELKERFKTLKSRASYEGQRQNLIKHLSHWLQERSGTWASYWPMESELSLQGLEESCRHLNFVYPKIISGKMQFLKAGPQGFSKGPLGFQEPVDQGAQSFELGQITGFLVPALGFDPRGVRLGRGKGFYDQVLEGASGMKMGIALEELIEPWLPEETRKDFGLDVRMDFLATEMGVKSVQFDK